MVGNLTRVHFFRFIISAKGARQFPFNFLPRSTTRSMSLALERVGKGIKTNKHVVVLLLCFYIIRKPFERAASRWKRHKAKKRIIKTKVGDFLLHPLTLVIFI